MNADRSALPAIQVIGAGIVLVLVQMLSINGMISSSFTYALGNTMIYAIVAIGFCLLLGYSGLASLGTAGFIGLGAYTAFYAIQGFGLPYAAAFLITLVLSLAIGVVIGFISLRIEGIYLAIMTLALSEIIRNLLMAIQATIKIDITNVRLFGVSVNEKAVYLLITATFVVLMLLTGNIIRSPVGRAMLAMKNSTSAAQAFGISLMKYRLLSFVIATVYAAIGGLLYMMYVRNMTTATSTLLTLSTSLNILGAVIIGGAKSLWGTAFGVFVIYGLQSMFLSKIPFFVKNPAFITMITGVLIILIVMFFPGGFAQILLSLRAKLTGQKTRTPRAGKEKQKDLSAEAAALHERSGAMHARRRARAKGAEKTADGHILEVDHLKMYFGGVRAVDDLSFRVKEGEIFGLIGPNGAGKTTVFNCITRFYKPTAGAMRFAGQEGENIDLNRATVHDVILHGVVRTFQNVEVIREMSVAENLLVAGHRQFSAGLFASALHLPRLKQEERIILDRANEVLDFMGLRAYANMPAFGLPYGVLKKIEIARTLMCEPRLIILDEPAAGLNETETRELAQLIRDIRDHYHCTILLVEHDMGLVMDVCDHICAIAFGKLLAYGTPDEIQKNREVQQAYLGLEEEAV